MKPGGRVGDGEPSGCRGSDSSRQVHRCRLGHCSHVRGWGQASESVASSASKCVGSHAASQFESLADRLKQEVESASSVLMAARRLSAPDRAKNKTASSAPIKTRCPRTIRPTLIPACLGTAHLAPACQRTFPIDDGLDPYCDPSAANVRDSAANGTALTAILRRRCPRDSTVSLG